MALFLLAMVLSLAHMSASTPSIKVNTTTVRSGEYVAVSWVEAMTALNVDLQTIPEMKTVWRVAAGKIGAASDAHEEAECEVVPSAGASSYWLGQFSPAIIDPNDIYMGGNPNSKRYPTEGTPPYTVPAPVKFISGTQLKDGRRVFKVSNMRTTVNWVLFEGSLDSATGFKVLALSPALSFTDAGGPMHGRLARTSSTDEMRVSWTSRSNTRGMAVQWGLSPTELSRSTAVSTSSSYTQADLCGAPANNSGFHSPGKFQTVVLDLSADSAAERLEGRRYWYRFGSPPRTVAAGVEGGWSSVRTFLAPKPVHPHAPLSIVVTADMGVTYEDGSQYHWEEPSAVNTTQQISSIMGDVEVVLHAGDLSYATGYESKWDAFMEQIDPVATAAPYMTGQGNHERDFPHSGNSIGAGDSGGECGVPTQSRFQMPTCAGPNVVPCIGATAQGLKTPALEVGGEGAAFGPVGSANDGWYSFDQGSVHFVMVNTEMSSLNGSRQHSFVAADLASVNRTQTPWVLVFGHRQMYSGNMMSAGNDMQDLEPLLMAHKVDIAFWGHIHFAQASCPMYHAKCVSERDAAGYDAPIHAVVGNAGQSLTAVPRSVPWSLYNEAHWGFSHVTVTNATDLRMDFYDDAPIGEKAPIVHSFAIKRAYPRV